MSCFLKIDDGKTRAVLTFKRDQLLYDIKNCAFIEGSVAEAEVSDHVRHMIQDIGEDGNVDRVTRVLDLVVAECREKLYAFTKHAVHRPELDDQFKETDVYGIVLDLPAGFSQTTLNYLEKLIHEYIVYSTLADWFGTTLPAKAGLWAGKAQNMEREIQASMHVRIKRTRVSLHPF